MRIENNWTRLSIKRAMRFPGRGDGLLNDEQETLIMDHSRAKRSAVEI